MTDVVEPPNRSEGWVVHHPACRWNGEPHGANPCVDPADLPEPPAHEYLSTACFHGRHDWCNCTTGIAGAKIPGQCKFCAAPCICECHSRVQFCSWCPTPTQPNPQFHPGGRALHHEAK